MIKITLVKLLEGLEFFRCTVADTLHRVYTIEMPKTILNALPDNFRKGTDREHIGIIAAGTILLSTDPEERFYKVDSSFVNRTYQAASKAQILGQFELEKLQTT
jgi:hypothetical protein